MTESVFWKNVFDVYYISLAHVLSVTREGQDL